MTLAAAGVAVLAHVPAAQAQYLGTTLSWQYYAYGSAYTGVNPFVDNGGIDGNFAGYFNILSDNNSVTFDYTSTSTWSPSALSLAPTIHNGIAIRTVAAPNFTSVTIDPSTNMVGFDASRISFTGTEIQIDWQNLPFDPNTVVK